MPPHFRLMTHANPARSIILAIFGGAIALLAWDASGMDQPLAAMVGTSAGFPLRHNFWLTTVMHDGAHRLAWVLVLVLCIGVWWPFGPLRRITLSRRLQLAVTPLAAVLVVNLLKRASGASCPWDMAGYGGVAQPLSHWLAFFTPDGGGGHCFPAGHASSGFAFIGGWFVLRESEPRAAKIWLLASLAIGFTLGITQQLRGAHFMSHTLWTVWVCFSTAWAIDALWRSRSAQRALA
jgi:membrane-associated PAP2 superfamily phosphatase